MNSRQKKMLARIIAAFCLTLAFSFIPTSGWIRLAVYLAIYLIIGWDILLKAFSGIIRGQVMDECFLMAVATVGAFALAIYSGSEDYLEAVAVMLFYQTGELFQSIAVHKSRRNISQLMDIRPDYANIEKDGKLVKTDPSSVPAGSTIVVLSGEKVPLDGIVLEGTSTLDTAALTGESLPRDVSQGSEVISGCINLTGRLVVRTTKDFGQSTVSKILELVENASSRKSRSENFISRFARIYTPVVCISALVLAVLPPVVLLLAGQERELSLTGIDLDPRAVRACQGNLQANGLTGSALPGDLCAPPFPAGSFDLVISNPPYFALGRGGSAGAQRSEERCTQRQLCAAAARLTRNGGRFALCCRPERLAELMCALRGHGLEPKRLQLLAHTPASPPSAALVEAVRQGRPGLEVLPGLFHTG